MYGYVHESVVVCKGYKKSTGTAGLELEEAVSHLTWMGPELQELGELYEHSKARPSLQSQSFILQFNYIL